MTLKQQTFKLLEISGLVFLEKGILIEDDGLCAIYTGGSFEFVCTTCYELDHILATQNLAKQEIKEERLCSQCEDLMHEGFYFKSDGTQYCSEPCLKEIISWAEYLKLHDNGDAYWTVWEDS